MTAPDPADTVIEQAAKVITNHSEHGACMADECSEDLLPVPYPRNRDDRNAFWDHHIARALHAAGLLADPADRDELIHVKEVAELAEKDRRTYHRDAIRAEAEVDELQHRLSCLLCELTGNRMSKTNYDVRTMVQEVEAYFERTQDGEVAELRAMVARVKAELDREEARPILRPVMANGEPFPLIIEVDTIRAALDGAGEQP